MEFFSTLGAATLSGTITNSATSLTITGGVNIPVSGTFRVRIENEIMAVTAVSGNNWTITRGTEGTTSDSHASGVLIYIVVTAAALDALTTIQVSGTEVSSRRVLNFAKGISATDDSVNNRINISGAGGFERDITFPINSNWSVLNSGGIATKTQNSKGAIFLKAPATSGDVPRGLATAVPSTPYTATMKVIPVTQDIDYTSWGVGWWDNVNSREQSLILYKNILQVNTYSYSSYNGSAQTSAMGITSNFQWFKLTDDGTHRTWYYGPDGENWIQYYQTSTTDWVTPTHVGIHCNPNNGTYDAGILLVSYDNL